MTDPSSPGNVIHREISIGRSALYEYIQSVDKCFPVVVTRLSDLVPTTKINFGCLFIIHVIRVYWKLHEFTNCDLSEALDSSLMDWATNLTERFLNDVLFASDEEKVALKQLLVIGLSPSESTPDTLPDSDNLITSLSSLQSVNEADRSSFHEFLEQHACPAPITLVIWLRDCVVLLILQSSQSEDLYCARTREVLFNIAESFCLHRDAVRMWERSIGEILHGTEAVSGAQATVSTQHRRMRHLKIGMGAVGGAVLLGVTGGLAFPLIATVVSGVGAAFTGIGLGAIGAAIATTSMIIGSVSIAGAVTLFGITGGSLVSYKLSNRFGELNIDDFKFKQINKVKNADDHSTDALEIILCVSGCLRRSQDYVEPWTEIRKRNGGLTDAYAVRWERKNLKALSNVFIKLLSNELAVALTNVYIQLSLGAVASTVALPITILNAMADLDNIMIVCENRAKQAGHALAEAIMNPEFGARPYTLIAYSVGCTAVFSCLEMLANAGKFSSIQNVVLIGSTIPCTFLYDAQRLPWQRARAVVSGRFINVYSNKDVLLHVLCRYLQWSIQVAGVGEVLQPGIENFDVSDIIPTHSDYPSKMGEILDRIGILSD